MGLEELEARLEQNAEKEIAAITAKTDAEEAQILADAREKAKDVKKKAQEEAASIAEKERTSAIAAARLEAKRIENHAREKAVEAGLNAICERLGDLRDDPRYQDLLVSLIARGKKELGDDMRVAAANADLAYIKKIGKKADAIDTAGGVLMTSPDGRIRIDATLERLFAHERERLRRDIYLRLFGDQKQTS